MQRGVLTGRIAREYRTVGGISMSYIKCEDLVLGYEGIPVAENISFEVGKGDYLCILGENGAGKSRVQPRHRLIKHQKL